MAANVRRHTPTNNTRKFRSNYLKRWQESVKHARLWVTELREEVTVASCDVIWASVTSLTIMSNDARQL